MSLIEKENGEFSGTIAIFGATGFLGGHLAAVMKRLYPNSRLLLISRLPRKSIYGESFSLDLLDVGSVASFLGRDAPDLVFHLAGAINCRDLSVLYDQNVKSTINLLEGIARKCPSCRMVVPGSAAEYGDVAPDKLPVAEENPLDPLFPYALSKVWQTSVSKYYAVQGLDVVMGRIFNVIGPGMADYLSIGSFAAQIRKIIRKEMPPTITVGNISVKRDFLDVGDVCRGLAALALSGKRGCLYNLCSGGSVVIGDMLDIMIKCSGVKVEIVSDQSKIRYRPVEDIYGSNEKIKQDTGWKPRVGIQQSLENICASL